MNYSFIHLIYNITNPMRKGTVTFACFFLLWLFNTPVLSNPELTDATSGNQPKLISYDAIEIQRYIDGGEWSNCAAELSGPDILCKDARGKLFANISGSIPKGCKVKPNEVKWKTEFSRNELTLFNKQGQNFRPGQPIEGEMVFVKVETDENRTKDIIAMHPCCGTSKLSITLNGPTVSERSNTCVPITQKLKVANLLNLGEFFNRLTLDPDDIPDIKQQLVDQFGEDAVTETVLDQTVGKFQRKAKRKLRTFNSEIRGEIRKAENTLEKRINALSPDVKISGVFSSPKCDSKNGNWTKLTSKIPTKISEVKAGGSVDFTVSVGISVGASVGLSGSGTVNSDVTLKGAIGFKTNLKTGSVLPGGTSSQRKLNVQTDVLNDWKFTFSGGGGASIKVVFDGALGGEPTLATINGELIAGKEKCSGKQNGTK